MTSMVQLEPLVDDCSKIIEMRLKEFAAQEAVIDLGHWLQCYAFDVVGQVTVIYPTTRSDIS